MSNLSDLRWLLWPAGLYLGYRLFLRPATPIYYRDKRQSDVPRAIEGLFMFLRPGSVVHMQHEDSPRRLRLRKVVLGDDQDGIRLELPRVAGAEDYEAAVRTALVAAGFVCGGPSPLDRLGPARDPALLIVDSLRTVDALRAVEVALAAMGLEHDAPFTIHMEGPPSFTAHKKYFAARSNPPAP